MKIVLLHRPSKRYRNLVPRRLASRGGFRSYQRTVDRQESISDSSCMTPQCHHGRRARQRKDIAQQSIAKHFAALRIRRDFRSQSDIFTGRKAEQGCSLDHQEAISSSSPYCFQDIHCRRRFAANAWRSESSAQMNPIF